MGVGLFWGSGLDGCFLKGICKGELLVAKGGMPTIRCFLGCGSG